VRVSLDFRPRKKFPLVSLDAFDETSDRKTALAHSIPIE
jgi:hypothetical protein